MNKKQYNIVFRAINLERDSIVEYEQIGIHHNLFLMKLLNNISIYFETFETLMRIKAIKKTP